MTTLRIESIFSNFSFYKQNYLNIINDPSQYYQVVESANIHFASFSDERLYLGDLLQLWLSDKWTEHQLKTLAKSHYLLPTQDGVNGQNSLFLFAFKKNSLFKLAYAYAWNTLENKVQEIALNESFPFYCHYLTLSRPKRV